MPSPARYSPGCRRYGGYLEAQRVWSPSGTFIVVLHHIELKAHLIVQTFSREDKSGIRTYCRSTSYGLRPAKLS